MSAVVLSGGKVLGSGGNVFNVGTSGGGGGGATLIFNFPNFSSVSGLVFNNSGQQIGNTIQVSAGGHNHGGVYWNTQLAPGPFTTSFSFAMPGLTTGSQVCGMSFIIQNIAAGTGFTGDANGIGFTGATNQGTWGPAVNIKFDTSNPYFSHNFPQSGTFSTPATTGLYLNGGTQCQPGGGIGAIPNVDMNPLGLNMTAGHKFNVNIVYDGTLITWVVTDTTTSSSGRFTAPLNLSNTLSSSNWIGFVGGGLNAQSIIYNWAYYSGYNTRLATPTFSPSPGQYGTSQTVTISYPSGSTCYYTLNGFPPTSQSTPYTGAISVTANTVIQAVAIQANYTDSLVGVGSFQIGTTSAINFSSGFTSNNKPCFVGYGYASGSTYIMNDATIGTASTLAYWPVPVTINASWSTTFQMTMASGTNGSCGLILQNPATAQGAYSLSGVSITNGTGGISFASNAQIIDGSTIVVTGATGIAAGSYMLANSPTTTTAVLLDKTGAAITTTTNASPGGTWKLCVPCWPGGLGAIGYGGHCGGYAGQDAYAGVGPFASGGLLNSLMVYINQQANTAGFYTGGLNPSGNDTATGLNLSGGGTWNVSVSYDGSANITCLIQASTGGTTFNHSWSANVPNIVGANTAYVAVQGSANDSQPSGGSSMSLNSWTGMNP